MADEHHHNIVMMLQSKLATSSVAFKDVLELRTQVRVYNCKLSKSVDIPIHRRIWRNPKPEQSSLCTLPRQPRTSNLLHIHVIRRLHVRQLSYDSSVLYNNSQRTDPMGDGSPSDQKGKGRAHQNGDVLSLDLNTAEEGGSRTSNGFMQMQLLEQQVIAYPLVFDTHLT